MDVSPAQIVSVAASLVPFLEHDDANRALMGANMQRQAVPVLLPEKPFVGTGIERVSAVDSGTVDRDPRRYRRLRRRDPHRGARERRKRHPVKSAWTLQPDQVSAFEPEHEHPSASDRQAWRQDRQGRRVADGASTDLGELALGQNMLIAFMPWNGYNFEDSILISERVVAEGRYTSIHIEELVVMARDTKLGAEEITRDIPNLAEQQPTAWTNPGSSSAPKCSRATRWSAGHAQGRNHADARRKLLRDLRREGFRREGHLAARGSGLARHRDRRAGVHPRRHHARQAPQQIIDDEAERFRLGLNDQLRIVEADAFDRIEKLLTGKVANGGPNKLAKGTKLDKAYLVDREVPLVRHPSGGRRSRIAARVDQELARADAPRFDLAFEEKRKEAHAGRRAARGRAQDGQGLPGRQAPPATRRQDGRPPRQQGRGVEDRSVEDMPHMADGAVRHLPEPAGRAFADERRPGARSASELGWQGGGASATCCRRRPRWPKLRKFLDELYNGSGRKEDLGKLSDSDVLEMAQNLSQGVPFATPVFDGASEKRKSAAC
jgi:DNA-directed RNA polymerase subunit beta